MRQAWMRFASWCFRFHLAGRCKYIVATTNLTPGRCLFVTPQGEAYWVTKDNHDMNAVAISHIDQGNYGFVLLIEGGS